MLSQYWHMLSSNRKQYQDIDLLAKTGNLAWMQEPEPQSRQSGQRSDAPALITASQPQGVFTVGERGEVGIDYLFDGGSYQSEMAVFSLAGMDLSQAGSTAFVQEAARRALSNGSEGFVAIQDRTTGAKFSSALDEQGYNHGDYKGLVWGSLAPGSQFGLLLVPQGTVAEVAQGMQEAIVSVGDTQPLVDLTGAGNTFGFEDRKLIQPQGGDYNDLVFQVRGATGVAPQLGEVGGRQWQVKPEGAALVDLLEQSGDVVTYNDRFFNPSERFSLIGQVGNLESVAAVEVWLRDRHGGVWQRVEEVTAFDEVGRFSFESGELLGAGSYEVKTVTRYGSGVSEASEVRDFTVLSLPEGEELSDRIKVALGRTVDLDRYDSAALTQSTEWVVSVQAGQDSEALAAQFGITEVSATNLMANTYRWTLPEDVTLDDWLDWFSTQPEIEYAYPLISFNLDLYSPSNEPLVANDSNHPDHQWHLTQSNVRDVWSQGIDGKTVTVGVIDTGFETEHLDLAATHIDHLSYDFDRNRAGVSGLSNQSLSFGDQPITDTTFSIEPNLHYSDGRNKWFRGNLNLYSIDLSNRFQGQLDDLEITFRLDHEGATNLDIYLFPLNNGDSRPQEHPYRLPGTFTDGGEYHFSNVQLEPLFETWVADSLTNLSEWNWHKQTKWALAIADQFPEDGQSGWLRDLEITATYKGDHGTQVAGVLAADGNNNTQGSGVAPGANWVALQAGADGTTDLELATALTYGAQKIDIYQNSWGLGFFGQFGNPDSYENRNSGMALSTETVRSIENNIQTGREGKGSIYVFAGGNSKQQGGRTDYNALASHRYTIAVGAVDHQNQAATYSNPGASLLISAYSDGRTETGDRGIVTTDLGDSITNSFGGTSAAAPFVSGVVALMLEANPRLTWRDVQHVLIQTANRSQLADDGGWTTEVNGIAHHHQYGFGLVDPKAAVEAAKLWKPLNPEQSIHEARVIPSSEQRIQKEGTQNIWTIDVLEEQNIESVEVVFDGEHANRSDLKIILESPSGTQSVLADFHGKSYSDSEYDWTFTSLRHWGESSQGTWRLIIEEDLQAVLSTGKLKSWELKLHGTEPTDPINPNQHPEATPFNQAHAYTEDQPLTLTPIVVTDAEGDTVTVTLKLADATAGQLSNGTINSDAQGLWQVTGTPEQVSAALANVQFIPTANYNSDMVIETSVMDTEMASPLYGAIDLTGIPVNDAPELTNGHLSQTPVVGQTTAITYADLLAATNPTDIENDPITFTIESLQSGTTLTSLPIEIAPGQALLWTPNSSGETVAAFSLIASDGQDDSTPVTITTEVLDAPLPTATVILAPVAANATEGGTPGQFVIVRAGLSLDDPLTVNYTLSGTATNGTDYTLPATLTIPAGQESALITVQPLSDALVESPETVTITLVDGPGYHVSSFFAPYTITIADSAPSNAAPLFTSATTATVSENQTGVIDVEATDDTNAEGAGLTFSITGGADATLFTIDPITGQLDFITAPDFENPVGTDNSYIVQVQVADADGLTATQDISVTVEDVVETTNPPIEGTPQADTLIGAVGDDTISGLGGDDHLRGEAGSDRLIGGDGHDTLIGGDDNDELYGGNHNDQLWGGTGHDRLYGGTGEDHLRGEQGNDRLEGNDGHDTLEGHDGDDELYGGNHNDQLYGGNGHDILHGGHNEDHLRGEQGNDILHGDDGHDILEGHDGDDELYGGNHNDQLHGGRGIDILHGDAGEDRLYGDDDNDTLTGGNDNDQLWGGHGDDRLFGNHGNDYLRGEWGDDRLEGGDGEDTLEGGSENDILLGGRHNDQLWGGHGEDELYGDAGNDHLRGEWGDDRLEGGDGEDTLEGGDQNDILLGGNHNDQLWGGHGEDELYGDAGNDHLRGEQGHDILDGGAGDDILEGHDHNDILRGGDGIDQLWGGHGEDELYGGNHNDHLRGEWGHDILDGGAGDDILEGHDHNDILRGGDGIDQIWGGHGEDELYGGNHNDYLRGEWGHDILDGGAGDDILEGHDHNDILLGGNDNDQLWGHAGTDTLNGGLGDDILDGGGESDTFVFDADWFGLDQINNFEVGIDKVDLAHFNGSLSLGALDSTNDGWVNGDDGLSLVAGNSLQLDLSSVNGGRITFNGRTQVAIADFEGLT